MRILVDLRLLAGGENTGIQEYAGNLLRAMMVNNKENEYIFFYNGFRKQSFPVAKFQISDSRLVDWHIPNKLLDFSSRFLSWPNIDNLTGADVVFSPHFNFLKTKKAPRVITFHDLSFLRHPYFFSYRQRFWHWLQGYRRQALNAAKIIAVSEHTKKDLIDLLKVPENKIEVIYSGISAEFKNLSSSDDDRKDLLAFKNSRGLRRPFWLYLGTLEPRKNINALIRAFNILKSRPRFKDYQLILAGRPGWRFNWIQKEVEASPFGHDIVFWGKVEPEERKFLYNLASVFVYPSFFEGFGFPPLEAQACGCPVVIADRTSLVEISNGSAIMIDPWRIGELADAMQAASESGRDKLIRAGLENTKRFDWKITAQKTLECLSNA